MTTVTSTTLTVNPSLVTKEKFVEPSLFGAGSSSAGGTDPITGVFLDLTSSESCLDDSRICYEMVDEFAPLKFFTSIRGMKHDQLFTEFSVGVARQMSLSADVRMRAEYNVKEKRRLKSMVESQGELLKAIEEEIESPKAWLLLREAKAIEAIRLHAKASNFETLEKSLRDETNALREPNVILKKKRNALDVKVMELEALARSKERELTDLNAMITSVKSQNNSLADRVHELKISSSRHQEKVTVYENCMEQLKKFQDDRMKIIEDKFDKVYTNFVEMALHLEDKFHPHLLTTISSRRWLLTHGIELAVANCLNSPEYLCPLGVAIGKAIKKGMEDGLSAGITHGKEGRVLSVVATYNPFVEVNYIYALQQLQNMNFSLLTRLKSSKDASIEVFMNILCLEGPFSEKLRLNELQPNVDQLMVHIHHSPNQVVSATALSLALDVSSTEGTSNIVAVHVDTTMVQSITFASATTIAPISVDNYDVMGADDQAVAGENAASFPSVDDAKLNIPQ
uniref:Transposase (Putative), gypsy type n=1 Tax=Tanacetum cinerariifolium TaxID=118510 RepID=A0A699HJS2_TANCI|nr:hypothetical protein [Tanacetum cinerariifolium]